jgi:hypothetical protein
MVGSPCGCTCDVFLAIGVVCPAWLGPSERYVDQGSQTTHPWTGSRGLRGNQGGEVRRPAQLTLSHSLWRLEATSTGGPTSSGHPTGVPASQGSRPATDSRTQGYFRGPSPQDVALRGVMQALVRIQAYNMLAEPTTCSQTL